LTIKGDLRYRSRIAEVVLFTESVENALLHFIFFDWRRGKGAGQRRIRWLRVRNRILGRLFRRRYNRVWRK
jgi:hypothetical protein